MKNAADETIRLFANRDDGAVGRITMAFALGGALLDIGAHALSAMFANGGGISGIWGMWIPLCFITIPPIHYLCRRVQSLERRLDALESQGGGRPAA
jgi:hypothetical protein